MKNVMKKHHSNKEKEKKRKDSALSKLTIKLIKCDHFISFFFFLSSMIIRSHFI